MNWMNWVILIAVIVGIIVLLIFLPLYLQAYNQLNQCRVEANFWCWWDYVCVKGTTTYSCPTQLFYGCGPDAVRAENYCTDNPGGTGCNCRLDADGNVPDTCTCAYKSSGTLGTDDARNFNALCNGNNIPWNPKPVSSS